ncbi:IS3 family transposase [Photobacterium atrarenae]|uniref:IS3 family transposase n=1 Tax=Photobacterium atrarenae TaxID=865757 RepID=A0ABY5GJK2_9GAMM|nr:IS3 family transposase [Photobacterium atrarenae]UTV26398.1 IS3 family transposase [Photobacterium atrarenae]UTV27209.1 IS3 family transposase [Photobacterium atrarenae]UTV27212.1 IS3 family transposase [Photobacterium atrarenae]UTV29387.1 IS3 family transposase [Photobacterium atrarenae]UTV30182.1 IS3 family transposase [Photobacterium atrarenae]
MPRYSEERKAAILKKLLPPHNKTIPEVAAEEHISEATLYNWRSKLRSEGKPVPGSEKNSEQWSAEAKFATVIETASLSETELSQYCREKGLYPEQVKAWKLACISGAAQAEQSKKTEQTERKADKKRIRKLETELRRKDKALAETAALLVLFKKAQRLVRSRGRGRLTPLDERQTLLQLFDEAVANGAPQYKTAELIQVPERTLRRWRTSNGHVLADLRPLAIRPEPKNKLSKQERQHILDVCNDAEYASLPPSQIVPRLADKGDYIASESTIYRVLKANDQLHHRGRAKPHKPATEPVSHVATKPNEIWTWDISYLPSNVRGLYWYLYMVIDIYSRKIVGWEVHDRECGALASQLIERATFSERCFVKPRYLHSDNGAPMKSLTLRAKLDEMGISTSFNRPGVSNDNAYSESLFRTTKYRPDYPAHGFKDLAATREWMLNFVNWYNNEHRHSAIKFVTPAERHRNLDAKVLAKRHTVYQLAKAKHPERWAKDTRDWSPIGAVTLNPERADNNQQGGQKRAA